MKIKIKDVNKLKEDLSKLDFIEIIERKDKIFVNYKSEKINFFDRLFNANNLLTLNRKETIIDLVGDNLTANINITIDHLKQIIDLIHKNREATQ